MTARRCGCGWCCFRLQYRSHPAISTFPSRHFYGGRLRDADGMAYSRRQLFHMLSYFQPMLFFNLRSGQ